MIVSNLIGGLGNQMFQYACGRALSLRTGFPLRLAADQFEEYRQQHNGLELLKLFGIKDTPVTSIELRDFLGIRSIPKLRRLLGRPLFSGITGKNWCNEPYFNYWPGILDINYPVYLHGYWQSEEYFSAVSGVIRDDFTFRGEFDSQDSAVIARMNSGISASIHVRRGDYLKGKSKHVYAACNLKYYTSAVRLLQTKYPEINFFAFSDEPDWVIKYLAPEIDRIEVVAHNSGERSSRDLLLMSHADHHIIANSSFSWWGAWLNPSKEKTVIAPKTWFSDGRQTPTLLPSSWIRI